MRGQNRRCYPGILNHCYQRTLKGYLIFYNRCDYLLFYTILCIVAQRSHVQILTLCLMPDHYHLCVVASSRMDLYRFVQMFTSLFARENNRQRKRKGPFFQSPFGSASKVGDKKARSALIYSYNNPVERRLCEQAEDYRWNFLAYAGSDHPFSEPIRLDKASAPLRRALKNVTAFHRNGWALRYDHLRRLFQPLCPKEKEQLTDFIITTYSFIDHTAAIRFFGSYESLLTAVHSTTGSEYDLNEIFIGRTDAVYEEMTRILMDSGRFGDIHEVLSLPDEEKREMFLFLSGKTAATPGQIAKYLQFEIKRT